MINCKIERGLDMIHPKATNRSSSAKKLLHMISKINERTNQSILKKVVAGFSGSGTEI
jgi:hypothetical protein